MKNFVLTLLCLCFSGVSFAQENAVESRIEKLEDRILELEAQNSLNKFRLSGTFLTRYEDMNLNHGTPGTAKEKEALNPMSMYFGLNVDFDITKNLKFYSTLGMAKFFNNENRNESLDSGSIAGDANYQSTEMGSWSLSGSGVKVDRAYASYEMDSIPMTIAFGRMPTNNGPPSNQLDGMPRQGTYPRFVFNAIFDGVAAVYDFSSKLPSDHSFKVRAFYQPFTVIGQSDRTRQQVDGEKLKSHVSQAAILAEYALQNTVVAKRIDLMFMHAGWKDFYVGYNGSQASSGSAMTGQTEKGSDDGIYLGLENIAGSGLNFSWSALLYQAVDSALPDLEKKAWGHLVNVNESFWGKFLVGYEYIQTQKYFYLDEWTRLNLVPFYSLQNAKGHHVYFGFPIADKMSARIGSYQITAGEGDVFQPEELNAVSGYAQVRMTF